MAASNACSRCDLFEGRPDTESQRDTSNLGARHVLSNHGRGSLHDSQYNIISATWYSTKQNWPASIRKPKSPRKTNRARCLSLVPGTNEAQTTTYCPFFAASRCHSITFWKMPLPPDSITSPWHGMILSKSHPLIFAMLLL